MGILDLCEEYFGQRDVYKLLEVPKEAPAKDIKKAYYKLSLQVHPDRVSEQEKSAATEKFKVLSKVYQVLTDKDKRALYDEQGVIDDEDDMESKLTTWLDLWGKIFKPLTTEDIINYEKSYIGSEMERGDIKKAYLSGKGCINHMMNVVPFLNVENEPRIQQIVREMIDAKEVPEYKIFTKEPAQKRQRRHKKYARESKEADELKKKLQMDNSLEKQIMQRQQSRESTFNSLLDTLMAKYGNDDSETFEISSGKKKSKRSTSAKKNQSEASSSKLHSVKNGRVSKRQN